MSAEKLYLWRDFVFSQYGPPDPSTRLVLAAISLHINTHTGEAWPSQQLLTTETGLGLSSVKRHLARAVEEGWLTREFRREDGRKYSHHIYRARIPKCREQQMDEFIKNKQKKRNRSLGHSLGITKEEAELENTELDSSNSHADRSGQQEAA